MATELENRFFINNEECKYAVDETPAINSEAFVTSGALYEWCYALRGFIGHEVIYDTTQIVANSENIPSVGVLYEKTKNMATYSLNTQHLNNELKHNIIYVIDGINNANQLESNRSSHVGKTIFISENGPDTKFAFVKSASTHYFEKPQEGVVYYCIKDPNSQVNVNSGLCRWNGGALVNL